MHADITRDTFDPARHFSRVLMQQGRVPLDADLNEQASILLHYVRTLAADLMGPHAGPRYNLGFGIQFKDRLLTVVGPGRYYVEGLLCEIEGRQTIPVDETAPGDTNAKIQFPFLVYLEVWEQLVTAYQHPLLRETALGGPDTAARAQVAWRVRSAQLQARPTTNPGGAWKKVREGLRTGEAPGGLAVRAGSASTDTLDPCVLPPDARYRGMENQLYRVEIHTPGRMADAVTAGDRESQRQQHVRDKLDDGRLGGRLGGPTFKWSRENGSVVFAIRSLQGVEVEVETLGLDPRLDLSPGDWVEITDDRRAADGRGMLARVADVDRDGLRVMLEDTDEDYPEYDQDHADIHPLLRRWDQSDPVILRAPDGSLARRKATLEDGAVQVVDGWIELEAGISVRFEAGRTYQPGDYWLIPARVATGDVEWPEAADGNCPATVPARRPERFLAPLAIVTDEKNITDLRRCIGDLTGLCDAPASGAMVEEKG